MYHPWAQRDWGLAQILALGGQRYRQGHDPDIQERCNRVTRCTAINDMFISDVRGN